MEATSSPLAPPAGPATDTGKPHRCGRGHPNPEERALADQITNRAMRLRDGADDEGLSIREAIELATIQIGATR